MFGGLYGKTTLCGDQFLSCLGKWIPVQLNTLNALIVVLFIYRSLAFLLTLSNMKTSLLIVILLCALTGLFSCTGMDDAPCRINGSNGCLLVSRTTVFQQYTNGVPGASSSPYKELYTYEERLPAWYYAPSGSKSPPYVHYLYKNCSVLAETRSGSSTSDNTITIARYTYNSDGSPEIIQYISWWKPGNKQTSLGYARFRYAGDFQVAYYYDSASVPLGYDSVMLYPDGTTREKWEIRQTVVYQYTYKQVANVHPSANHVGDQMVYYTNGNLQFTETTDSAYYNEYGYDTLSYAGRKDASGAFTGISTVRKTYTGCR